MMTLAEWSMARCIVAADADDEAETDVVFDVADECAVVAADVDEADAGVVFDAAEGCAVVAADADVMFDAADECRRRG